MNNQNAKFMCEAIKQANLSGVDVPVGAVIVNNGEIIAACHNEKEKTNDITAHAEILAIKKTADKLKNWRLNECELYVTLEPCPMCAWAILQSRIKAVYFGSSDTQYGAFGSVIDLKELVSSNVKIYSGFLEEECDNIIKDFWLAKRR